MQLSWSGSTVYINPSGGYSRSILEGGSFLREIILVWEYLSPFSLTVTLKEKNWLPLGFKNEGSKSCLL